MTIETPHQPKRATAAHRERMNKRKALRDAMHAGGVGMIGLRGVAASINRHTGKPHLHAREIARRLARAA